MRISDWSSDVGSSDLHHAVTATEELGEIAFQCAVTGIAAVGDARAGGAGAERLYRAHRFFDAVRIEGQAEIIVGAEQDDAPTVDDRSEEHTSELQSLMRISYAVFCLKKKNILKRRLYSSNIIHTC